MQQAQLLLREGRDRYLRKFPSDSLTKPEVLFPGVDRSKYETEYGPNFDADMPNKVIILFFNNF